MDPEYKGFPVDQLIPEGAVLTDIQRSYLEATAYLFSKSDHVKMIDVARLMGKSTGSVHSAMMALSQRKILETDHSGSITLLMKGMETSGPKEALHVAQPENPVNTAESNPPIAIPDEPEKERPLKKPAAATRKNAARINIYKGFPKEHLEKLKEQPLVDSTYEEKINVLQFDKKYRKRIDIEVLSLEEEDVRWMTYEEYAYAHDRIDLTVAEEGLEVCVYRNNLLPDYYPLPFEIEPALLEEILKQLNDDSVRAVSEKCQLLMSVYSDIVTVDGKLYCSFYNYEYEKTGKIKSFDFYPASLHMPVSVVKGDVDILINDDITSYLRDYQTMVESGPATVTVRKTNSEMSKRIEQSLIAYCQKNGIILYSYHEPIGENNPRLDELNEIAKSVIRIPHFKSFRNIKFYRDPDVSNEVMDVSQAQIITDIIEQAESAYDSSTGNSYRDIFITAFTGAGKSVMFQVPAVYLAQKYKKLTIIIEPVKSLMQDQKEQLNARGYDRVEVFNSDLITQTEKEKVLRKVKEGEVDLLYLSPETLLSYSMDTIIGDREIGLIIVDEAHIVTTWGIGFRPDYWYLGGYLNGIRHAVQIKRKGYERKIQHFPICAFTATAINTGIDDSVSETIVSLYMENPIKYIGYIKRDDIRFQIKICGPQKMSNEAYEESKAKTFSNRIDRWLFDGTKTVVYFPYATYAKNAYDGTKSFSAVRQSGNERIGIYTGRNVYADMSLEEQATIKKETFNKFRTGEISVMYATKAFGMGVDIDDIENVYHYAVTGNLCDYVQEIGRAARKTGLTGTAITDYFYNDISFMQRLFGMSQIRQYQVQKVLAGIYDVYRSKGESRNFLVSPEAFSYIFAGKKKKDNPDEYINQLKTCLMMLEKDLADKFNFKVMITRPRSIFTNAFVVVDDKHKDEVLNSKYGNCLTFVERGRDKELDAKGDWVTDYGDVYRLDLKTVWETHYQNMSFPQFKYWYFNKDKEVKDKVDIMPEIRDYIFTRQKVTIEVKRDLLLCDLRQKILEDFEYITQALYDNFGHTYFKLDDFARVISKRFGGMTKARVIANNLFELVDPTFKCVKSRHSSEDTSGTAYTLSNGTFKEYLKRPIIKSELCLRFTGMPNDRFSKYMPVVTESTDLTALKLLSIFDYITYEIQGGENPEIFIRLNDPAKVRRIVMGEMKYSNSYVTRAKHKHDRDVKVLRKFFTELDSDESRWKYIEDYFLGHDVLEQTERIVISKSALEASIDKHKSTLNTEFRTWTEIADLMEDSLMESIREMNQRSIPVPTYLNTEIKKELLSGSVIMSWPEKNVLIFGEEISPEDRKVCEARGWTAMDLYNADMDILEKELK